MNLHSLLQEHQAAGRPVRVLLIGAGKFGSMYLSQARRTPGIRIHAIADLSPDRARASLERVGWTGEMPKIVDDSMKAIADPSIEVGVGATAHPAGGVAPG